MGDFKSIKDPGIIKESRTRKNYIRFVWSHELHQKFLNAIEQLGGNDKATPKKILAVMNVEGLTRLNVATHLQKYRQCCSTEAHHLNMATRKLGKLPSSEHLPQSPSTNHHSSLSPRVQDVNIRFNQLHLH